MNEVVIEVKADNSQLAKDLKTAKREVEKFDKEAERLTTQKEKIKLDLSDYYEQKRLLNETTKEELRLARSVEDTTVIQDNYNRMLDKLKSKYSTNLGKLSEINAKIKQNEISQQLTNARVDELNGKINKLNFDKVKDNIGKITTGMNKTLKAIAKWIIAVFGLRSAINLVRKASSTLAQYNDQYAQQLEYINVFLASALQPLLIQIVSLAATLLQYIDYIVSKWFRFNIISSANQKTLAKAAKSTKEMSNNLASWDDLTVLSDGDVGTAGGANIPTMEPLSDEDAPAWIKFIAQNKDAILAVMAGIASGLLLWNIGLKALKALGIGIMIAGIVYLIENVIDYLNDPTWKNFGGILQGIMLIIGGIAIAFKAWPIAAAAAMGFIIAILVKHWDEIKSAFEQGRQWIFDKSEDLIDWLVNKLGWLSVPFVKALNILLGLVDSFISGIFYMLDGVFNGVRQILDGIILMFRGNFKQGITTTIRGILNLVITMINWMISGLNAFITPVRSLIVALGKVMGKSWTMSNIKIPSIPKLEDGAILRRPGPGVNIGGAIGGEKGAEVMFPLENSKFIDSFADKIAGKVNSNQTITFKGSLSELVRLLKPELDRESIRQGSKIIVGGN